MYTGSQVVEGTFFMKSLVPDSGSDDDSHETIFAAKEFPKKNYGIIIVYFKIKKLRFQSGISTIIYYKILLCHDL